METRRPADGDRRRTGERGSRSAQDRACGRGREAGRPPAHQPPGAQTRCRRLTPAARGHVPATCAGSARPPSATVACSTRPPPAAAHMHGTGRSRAQPCARRLSRMCSLGCTLFRMVYIDRAARQTTRPCALHLDTEGDVVNTTQRPPQPAGAQPLTEAEYSANLRRATLSSSVGSALEYFDFAMYGLMTALVFDRLFFSTDNPAMATVAAFGIYGVGFAARPFGGLFFGTLGDRIGRRWVLVATIILMGGSSTLIGVLPTYEQAGILAPILLVILRLAQGFGAGAEQAGATVLMAEYSPVKRRGFLSALPFVGIQAGTLLASLVFFFLSLMPEDAFLSWGWRIPFLASVLLILIALYIRAKLQETPAFVQLEKQEQVAERPIREIFTRGRSEERRVGKECRSRWQPDE